MSATSLRFRIEDWQAYAGDAAARDRAPAAPVPTMLRRRVSSIGQAALRAAHQNAGVGDARFVFCSRHGEFERTLSLLKSITAREPVSPADFSLSVHNALAGLLSIATKNTHGHTAIAGGRDSFGFGMLEGALCLDAATDEKVLVVYFDAPLPETYAEIGDDAAAPFALALLLMKGQGDGDDVVMSFAPHDGPIPAPSGDRHGGAIVDFLQARRGDLRIDGAQMDWRFARAG